MIKNIRIIFAVVVSVWGGACSGKPKFTSESFALLAKKEPIEGMSEGQIQAVFGKPSRVRRSADHFVYAYDCPTSSPWWDTECVIRFDASSLRATAWQINSD